MGLAVAGEDLLDVFLRLLACLTDGLLNHAPAAVWHHGTLERSVGLQADDDVVILRDVAGRESIDVGWGVGVDIENALLALY